MPKSHNRKGAAQRNANETQLNVSWSEGMAPSPTWWAPLSLTLMVIGLLYVIVFYLSSGTIPVPGIGNWNLAIGFGIIMAGFLMLLRWK